MTLRLAVTFPITEENLLDTSEAELDHPAWDDVTAYSEFQKVIRGHKRFEALQDNTGKDPLEENMQDFWLPLGSTNRWRAFDNFLNDPVIGTEGEVISYTLGQIAQPVSVIACLGLVANSIRLKVTLPDDRVIYDRTYSLRDNTMITDGFMHCFEPLRTRSEAVFNEIPPYSQAVYEITISPGGEVAQLGQIVLGREYEMGDAQFGTSFGIDDYSVVNRNDYGALSIIERPFSKVVDFRSVISVAHGRRAAILLEDNRAKPVLVFAGDDSDVIGVTVYGKLGDWRIETVDAIDSDLKLTVEGFA